MAHLLGAERIALAYPNRIVLDDISLGVNEGDRIGIVGRNGDGKSSLLGMLAGRFTPNSGRVTVRNGVSIGVLDQADVLDDQDTVGHAIVGDRAEYEWAGDAKVRDVIDGLVRDLPWDGRIDSLSGGQRRRVALAHLLVGDDDVLALDEPTNHLDVEGIAWLAQHLKQRWAANSGGLLVVTHDRWFLDEVCTTTWEVHDHTVEPFDGGYAAYVLQRVERDRQAAVVEQRRQNLARKELAWLRRGAPARSSKPKFRIDAANELIADVSEIRDSVSLQSLAVQRLGKDVVDLVDAGVSYGDHQVLHDIDWRLAPGERTGILGVNGAGKSTLLGLIDGSVSPTSGRVKRGKTVNVATLTQRVDELNALMDEPVRTVIGSLKTSYQFGTGTKAQELTPSQLLERLGFSSGQLSTIVKDLSGGQLRRLQLLLILLDQPNVLILDEPTNDLDIDMLAAIEDLLDSWPGTLIVVSHDRYFLERVTDNQYAVMHGTLRHLPRGVDEYLQLRHDEERARHRSDTHDGAHTSAPHASGKHSLGDNTAGQPVTAATSLSGAERRAAEKELAAIERKLAKLTEQIDSAKTALADYDQSDYVGLNEAMASIGALETTQSELEGRWFELSELTEG